MFELNKNLEIKEDSLLGSKIFTIDNFYENPDEVCDFIFNREVPLWKMDESPSYNGLFFNERRLIQEDDRLIHIYNFLSDLCGMNYKFSDIVTNMIRFSKNSFNDYENCFMWPHTDRGWNGIVYLNKDEENSGTNLYDPKVLEEEEWQTSLSTPEHYSSWRPKEKYSVLKSFKSKYNSLCLFDGSKFPHNMNITNDRFFRDIPLFSYPQANWDNYRCNQVFFFNEKPI
tara:strand:- start:116 stop:799 length:684 start_codon:yes stop_codon:yes gene_type:complete